MDTSGRKLARAWTFGRRLARGVARRRRAGRLRGECLESRSLLAAVVGPIPTDDGQWWQFRGDRQLTGRSELPGQISSPELLWSHFVGGRRTWVELDLAAGAKSTVALPAADINAAAQPDLSLAWDVGGPYFDLDGDGAQTRVAPTSQHKIGEFRPDWPGLEMIQFTAPVAVDGGTTSGLSSGVLWRRENRTWVEAWRTPPLPDLFAASPIVADLLGDASPELAILGRHELYVLSLDDGSLVASATFSLPGTSGRGYGWFGARDLDRDGRPELVICGDFENFISVLGWRGGRLERLWGRLIEPGISNKQSVHHPGLSPLADVDGDGQLDLVTSIYNERGDGRWHTLALAGLTGATLLDLPGQYVSGLADVNADGSADLLLTAVSGERLPDKATIKVLSFARRQQTTLWQQSSSSFETYEAADYPAHINGATSTGRRAALAGPIDASPRPAWVTRRVVDTGTVELGVRQIKSGATAALVATVKGPGLDALALRPTSSTPELLVQVEAVEAAAGSITTTGAAAAVALSRRIGAPRSSAVVGRLAGGERPTLIVQGAAETVQAFQVTSRGSVTPRWTAAGRGVFTGSSTFTGQQGFGGVVLADLQGDGALAALLAARGDSGQARLAALRPDGSPLWQVDFDRFLGPPPQWNQGGLTTWMAGRFRSPLRDDVLVSLRRSTMHTDELYLLDGRTGKVVWSRPWGNTPGTPPAQRGAGGTWMALADWDGDGLDEAINTYPDVLYVVDGSGVNRLDRSFANGVFGPGTALYGLPVVDDFLGPSSPALLYGASAYKLGVLNSSGQPHWAGPWQDGTPGILPGVGDLNGDGRLELVAPGHQADDSLSAAELRWYQADDGTVLDVVPTPGQPFTANGSFLPGSPTSPAVADLDGDGRDEALYGIGDTLYAVGASADGTRLEPRWSLRLAGNLGTPILADVNGDGRLQIVVVSDNGFVYGVGQRVVAHESSAFYLSLRGAATLTGSDGQPLSVAGADVFRLGLWDDGSYAFGSYFRGQAVGLEASSESVDAFDLVADGSLLVSTFGDAAVRARYDQGLGSGTTLQSKGQDVLRFTPDVAGDWTTGSWSLAFDGSEVGLSESGENLDAVAALPDGRLLLSTTGSFSVPGVSGDNKDLLAWSPADRAWSLYFDGSDVGLSGSDEDLVALAVRAGPGELPLELLLATRGNFAVPGAAGANEDVVRFRPQSLGAATTGAFDAVLALDGSQFGLAAHALDGVDWAPHEAAPLASPVRRAVDAALADPLARWHDAPAEEVDAWLAAWADEYPLPAGEPSAAVGKGGADWLAPALLPGEWALAAAAPPPDALRLRTRTRG